MRQPRFGMMTSIGQRRVDLFLFFLVYPMLMFMLFKRS